MPTRERILVRGVNWLGDAVMTTPALQRLREARPAAQITLFTHKKLADLWQGHPSIDRVLTFDSGSGVLSTARRLRGEGSDIAIVFPNSIRSALEVFLAGIPTRIGYGGSGRGLLFTRPLRRRPGAARMRKRSRAEIHRRIAANLSRETFPPSAHQAHEYLHLIAAFGANAWPMPPMLFVSDAEVTAARSRFNLNSDLPVVALNPGAEYGPAKRWPLERFVAVAVELHRESRCRSIVLGGNADRELGETLVIEVRKRVPTAGMVNIAGQTSLRELSAVLKASVLLLTNDTGPMHVAAALGTPVIVPFGSTSPDLTGPGFGTGAPHQLLVGEVPCAPCFLRECPIDFRCMKGISVEQVVAATRRVLTNA